MCELTLKQVILSLKQGKIPEVMKEIEYNKIT